MKHTTKGLTKDKLINFKHIVMYRDEKDSS